MVHRLVAFTQQGNRYQPGPGERVVSHGSIPRLKYMKWQDMSRHEHDVGKWKHRDPLTLDEGIHTMTVLLLHSP